MTMNEKNDWDLPSVIEKLVYGKLQNTLKFKMASTRSKYASSVFPPFPIRILTWLKYLCSHQSMDPQSSTKYLRQPIVFMWNSALHEKFIFYFSVVFRWYWKNFILGGRLGSGLYFYEVLRFYWYFLIS